VGLKSKPAFTRVAGIGQFMDHVTADTPLATAQSKPEAPELGNIA
jgi:hypothetical protein